MSGRFGRIARRIIHLPQLPLKLKLPSSLKDITEISFRTVPNATKIEIKRFLEDVYGLPVARVNTLNMDGKKKRFGGAVLYKPDYKKAYVTLKYPVSLPDNLFPFNLLEQKEKEEKEAKEKERERKKKR